MSSSRLYGKVLMKVNENLFFYIVDRIKKAKKIDKIIVATNPNDQKIVQFYKKNRIKFLEDRKIM